MLSQELRHQSEVATLQAEHSAVQQGMQERLTALAQAAEHSVALESQLRAVKRAEEEASHKVQFAYVLELVVLD